MMVVTVVVMLTNSGDGDIDGDDHGNDGCGDGTCDGSDE
jgi:hypothetical protein